MEATYVAYSRRDDASVTVKDGRIVSLSIGDYKSDNSATREDSIEKFLCCLRNVFDMLIRHNREGFDQMMEEIRIHDSELYYYGEYMLECYEKEEEEMEE